MELILSHHLFSKMSYFIEDTAYYYMTTYIMYKKNVYIINWYDTFSTISVIHKIDDYTNLIITTRQT